MLQDPWPVAALHVPLERPLVTLQLRTHLASLLLSLYLSLSWLPISQWSNEHITTTTTTTTAAAAAAATNHINNNTATTTTATTTTTTTTAAAAAAAATATTNNSANNDFARTSSLRPQITTSCLGRGQIGSTLMGSQQKYYFLTDWGNTCAKLMDVDRFRQIGTQKVPLSKNMKFAATPLVPDPILSPSEPCGYLSIIYHMSIYLSVYL